MGGATPGWTSVCVMTSSSCPTGPSCGRYGHREATGGSLWRCLKTSPKQLQKPLVLDGPFEVHLPPAARSRPPRHRRVQDPELAPSYGQLVAVVKVVDFRRRRGHGASLHARAAATRQSTGEGLGVRLGIGITLTGPERKYGPCALRTFSRPRLRGPRPRLQSVGRWYHRCPPGS